MTRDKVVRLGLSDLLAKPFQRIPRYRLLLERLIRHTEPQHPDLPLLRRAEHEIHQLALRINNEDQLALKPPEDEHRPLTCCYMSWGCRY